MKKFKYILLTFAVIIGASFTAMAQKGGDDKKPPPKGKPPVVVVGPKNVKPKDEKPKDEGRKKPQGVLIEIGLPKDINFT
jgi:hypothetical protein